MLATLACAAENETVVPKTANPSPVVQQIWPPPNVQTLPNPPAGAPSPPKLAPKGRYSHPWLPPVELDHPYHGIVTVRRLSEADIVKVCESKWWLKYPTHVACTFPFQNVPHCLIFLANDDVLKSYGQDEASTLRHEMGHCNGWGANHENARNPDGTAARR